MREKPSASTGVVGVERRLPSLAAGLLPLPEPLRLPIPCGPAAPIELISLGLRKAGFEPYRSGFPAPSRFPGRKESCRSSEAWPRPGSWREAHRARLPIELSDRERTSGSTRARRCLARFHPADIPYHRLQPEIALGRVAGVLAFAPGDQERLLRRNLGEGSVSEEAEGDGEQLGEATFQPSPGVVEGQRREERREPFDNKTPNRRFRIPIELSKATCILPGGIPRLAGSGDDRSCRRVPDRRSRSKGFRGEGTGSTGGPEGHDWVSGPLKGRRLPEAPKSRIGLLACWSSAGLRMGRACDGRIGEEFRAGNAPGGRPRRVRPP